MLLLDVNVLVYAHRSDSERHEQYRAWLDDLANGDEAFALSSIVLSGFVRVVTHPRVFRSPTPVDVAVDACAGLLARPTCVPIAPGPRHWSVFADLCTAAEVRGNLVPDAFLAALAIEQGCEFVTTDRDFARFPGLRWRHPLG